MLHFRSRIWPRSCLLWSRCAVRAYCLRNRWLESGCFGTDARATEVEPFSGECAVVFLNEFLVHSVHVSDLTASYADIAGGYVAVGAYILQRPSMNAWQKRIISRSLLPRGEVGAAFSSTHRRGCKGVFECLLESEEFRYGEGYETAWNRMPPLYGPMALLNCTR